MRRNRATRNRAIRDQSTHLGELGVWIDYASKFSAAQRRQKSSRSARIKCSNAQMKTAGPKKGPAGQRKNKQTGAKATTRILAVSSAAHRFCPKECRGTSVAMPGSSKYLLSYLSLLDMEEEALQRMLVGYSSDHVNHSSTVQ